MANVFLFYHFPKLVAGTSADHLDAFMRHSIHNVYAFDSLSVRTHLFKKSIPSWIDLDKFDAFVIHYSIFTPSLRMIDETTRARIRNYKGLKIIFIQDEYRQINQIHDVLRDLKIDILYTCVPSHEIEKVYPSQSLPHLIKINTLTGYVPEKLLKKIGKPNIRSRPIDVGYRARKLSAWYGQLGQEKFEIAEIFAQRNAKLDKPLNCDLSCDYSQRLYGNQWTKFILSCRTMLGVESGASVFDFTGDIQANVEAYEKDHPEATFEEIRNKFFKDQDGKIYLNQISPRCFEAIALKTPLVLFEGNYSGVLTPWRHYIPLKKDFSNFHEVVEAIRNPDFLEELAERAFAEVALNPANSYRQFISEFDAVVGKYLADRKQPHQIDKDVSYLWFSYNSRIRFMHFFQHLALLAYSFWRRLKYSLLAKVFYKLYRMAKHSIHIDGAVKSAPRSAQPHARVLCLCYYDPAGISTVSETIASMQRISRFPVIEHNLFELRQIPNAPLSLKSSVDLDEFSAIVIHNTVSYSVDNLYSLDAFTARKLRDYRGVKILMKQDENFRFEELAHYIGSTQFDLVLTCLADEDVPKVYPPAVAGEPRFERMLTGYITPSMRAIDFRKNARPIDIGYRGSIQPLNFGRGAFEKRQIGDDVARLLAGCDIKLDISSRWEDRIGGKAWLEFLGSCKAVLGTESGGSVFDLGGELSRRCKIAEKKLGPYSDDYEYAEAYLAEFADMENNIDYAQIAPRHFEAIAAGTVQILYPGNYSGILTAGRHYLPLERDYSNLDEIIDFIRNEPKRQQMAETAYKEIILNRNYWIENFVERFDGRLERELENKRSHPQADLRKHEKALAKILASLKSRTSARITSVMIKRWNGLPLRIRSQLKPVARHLYNKITRF